MYFDLFCTYCNHDMKVKLANVSEVAEADMEKASIGTIMISLLIANLPAEGSEGKIKNDLLKLFQKHPSPTQDYLYLFANKIKEIESLGLACEYRNIETGRG